MGSVPPGGHVLIGFQKNPEIRVDDELRLPVKVALVERGTAGCSPTTAWGMTRTRDSGAKVSRPELGFTAAHLLRFCANVSLTRTVLSSRWASPEVDPERGSWKASANRSCARLAAPRRGLLRAKPGRVWWKSAQDDEAVSATRLRRDADGKCKARPGKPGRAFALSGSNCARWGSNPQPLRSIP